MSRKKDSHKVMCRNSIDEIERRYVSMRNKTRKTVLETMKEKLELEKCPDGIYRKD